VRAGLTSQLLPGDWIYEIRFTDLVANLRYGIRSLRRVESLKVLRLP
jgi:hypothetical protein